MLPAARRPITPVMLDYKIQADDKSMYNTPPCWSIYIAGLVFAKMRADGGLAAALANNEKVRGSGWEGGVGRESKHIACLFVAVVRTPHCRCNAKSELAASHTNCCCPQHQPLSLVAALPCHILLERRRPRCCTTRLRAATASTTAPWTRVRTGRGSASSFMSTPCVINGSLHADALLWAAVGGNVLKHGCPRVALWKALMHLGPRGAPLL